MNEIVAADLWREAPHGPSENDRFCRGCGKWRANGEFSLRSAVTGQRRKICRVCCRETSRQHYKANRAAYLERNRRNTPRLRKAAARKVYEFLATHPCIECGEADLLVLEFNHRDPALKAANICDLIRSCTSAAAIEAEIAKCDVLCANCHQRHTALARAAHFKRLAGYGRAPTIPKARRDADARLARLVLQRLSEATCADCGTGDPLVLQFDHREGKAKDVGWLVSSGSRPGLIAQELDKCDVRCANCHRRRTALEGNWYRVKFLLDGEQTLPKPA